jgi:hypothetical protein
MHTKFTPEQLEGELFTINELCEAIDALKAEVEALKSR